MSHMLSTQPVIPQKDFAHAVEQIPIDLVQCHQCPPGAKLVVSLHVHVEQIALHSHWLARDCTVGKLHHQSLSRRYLQAHVIIKR